MRHTIEKIPVFELDLDNPGSAQELAERLYHIIYTGRPANPELGWVEFDVVDVTPSHQEDPYEHYSEKVKIIKGIHDTRFEIQNIYYGRLLNPAAPWPIDISWNMDGRILLAMYQLRQSGCEFATVQQLSENTSYKPYRIHARIKSWLKNQKGKKDVFVELASEREAYRLVLPKDRKLNVRNWQKSYVTTLEKEAQKEPRPVNREVAQAVRRAQLTAIAAEKKHLEEILSGIEKRIQELTEIEQSL